MAVSAEELLSRCRALRAQWQGVQAHAGFEPFVEFAVAVSSTTEYLAARGLAGLHQEAHGLEQAVLAGLEGWSTGAGQGQQLALLGQRVEQFVLRVQAFVSGNAAAAPERRREAQGDAPDGLLLRRDIVLVTQRAQAWEELLRQLRYYNIHAQVRPLEAGAQPWSREASIVLVDAWGVDEPALTATLHALRGRLAASCLIACEVGADFDSQNRVLGAGCDHCFTQGTPHAALIDRIVRVSAAAQEEPFRVLVVEDSRTAATKIARTLSEGGMVAQVVHDPRTVLATLVQNPPDLVLMDMYMPGCTGVEVTRVLRQHPEFLSTPVVYLSGDADVSLQVDALRLGGDHFLTKPFNPVVLNAVVKSKIERYRALRKHMFCDSLTGLFNHTTSKQRLDALVVAATQGRGAGFALAMLDIDHFKRVNDTWGHPVGDQVIRSMAWMLKQRLRSTDVVGRYGGEEFMVLLPGTGLAQARRLLDAIRLDFACIVHEAGAERFQCSFSAGVAQWGMGDSADAVLAHADEQLYAAKRAGRNRIMARSECSE